MLEFYIVTLANGFTATVRAKDKGKAYHITLSAWRRALVNGDINQGILPSERTVAEINSMTVLSRSIVKADFRAPAFA